MVTAQPLPNGLIEELELQVEPESVLKVCCDDQGTLQLLIKWKALPDYKNT